MTGTAGDTIWITGAGGFLGSTVARAACDRGLRVIGFDLVAAPPAAAGSFAGFHTGALGETTLAEAPVPTQVFHFAGGATVGASIAEPLRDFRANVEATAILLDHLRGRAPATQVVIASSAAVYGGGAAAGIAVDAPLRPSSPYGHHKAMAETLARSYASTFGLPVTILRLFSVYGAGIRKQLVFDLCRRLAENPDRLVLGGTGQELRDWCHVGDIARLCLDLPPCGRGEISTYNVGTGTGTPIAEVARLVLSAWGSDAALAFSGEQRAGDPAILVAAPDSMPPGFAPATTLADGLADYVAWFRKDRP